MSEPLRLDMTHLPDLAATAGRAGPVRTRSRSTSICSRRATRCPAGENIQAWLARPSRRARAGLA